MFNRNRIMQTPAHARGATLIDVLIAIMIFVVGMLALASLQGNLTRSSTDAKARTVGTNIAEEIIEGMRSFDTLRAATACPGTLDEIIEANAYQCVANVTGSVARSGLDYDVTVTVDDYYFLEDKESVTTDTDDLPAGRDTTISDFKYVEITLNWGDNATDFLTYDEDNPTADLGSGSFTLASIVPSAPPLGPAKVAANDDDAGKPPVNYTPGSRPDIIRIDLNGSKFKESTTPKPDVVRRDELVETWFDVVTYNNADPTIYIRREEFLVVTCECTLKSAGGAPSGLLPTVWNGASYTTGNNGRLVAKNYGVSANNQQGYYCDTCCRDHHDGTGFSGDDNTYDPVSGSKPKWSESGGPGGDHKHYSRDGGGLEEADYDDDYVEACRMVRKDGFMRVAQDVRQEGFYAFPAGYLDTPAGADEYSDYVTAAVADFYGGTADLAPPPHDVSSPPGPFDFPADGVDSSGNPAVDIDGNITDTTLLPLLGAKQQQMRSRGLYMDNQSAELVALLLCAEDNSQPSGYSADPEKWRECGAPGYTDVLQVLPFFEIQTTWLSLWDSEPRGTPVSVTSEAVNTDNSHSRGLAVLEDSSAVATVDVETEIHRGNIGLTSTDSITLQDTLEPMARLAAHLFVDVGGGGGAPSNTYTWTAVFTSSVNQVDALGVTITPNGSEFCAVHGTNEMSCSTPNGSGGSITITGYAKRQGQNYRDLWICPESQAAGGISVANTPAGVNNSAVVSWDALPNDSTITGVVLTIEDSPCG